MELLRACLATEVPGRAAELLGHTSLTELVTVVTADTLQTQPLDKILLKQQLAPCGGKKTERNEVQSGPAESKRPPEVKKKISTFTAERSLDPREPDRLMERLLFLAVLAERHNAVELLVVLAAGLAAELVDLILRRHTFRCITGKLKQVSFHTESDQEQNLSR